MPLSLSSLKSRIQDLRGSWTQYKAYLLALALSLFATSFLPHTPVGGVLGGAAWKLILVGLLQFAVIERALIPYIEGRNPKYLREALIALSVLIIAVTLVLANVYLVQVEGDARISLHILLFFLVSILSALIFSVVASLGRQPRDF